MQLTLNVNGQNYTVTVSNSDMPLLWVIRDLIGLTGTKYGCGIEVCGACTVLVDGHAQKSCDMDASEAVGKQITTIEGLSANRSHPAQQAWIAQRINRVHYHFAFRREANRPNLCKASAERPVSPASAPGSEGWHAVHERARPEATRIKLSAVVRSGDKGEKPPT